jgi:hypothetical protein
LCGARTLLEEKGNIGQIFVAGELVNVCHEAIARDPSQWVADAAAGVREVRAPVWEDTHRAERLLLRLGPLPFFSRTLWSYDDLQAVDQ